MKISKNNLILIQDNSSWMTKEPYVLITDGSSIEEMLIESIKGKWYIFHDPIRSIFLKHKKYFSLSGDRADLAEFIKKQTGIPYEQEGRSGFASRNSLRFHLDEEEVEIQKLTFDFINPNERYGDSELKAVELVKVTIPSPAQLEKINEALAEYKKLEHKKTLDLIASKTKNFVAVVKYGGHEELQGTDLHAVHDRYTKLAEKRVACTEDHRRNLTHTYECVLLNTQMVKGKNFVSIAVPDDYKGMVIGKGGRNIKKIQSKLNLRIKII